MFPSEINNRKNDRPIRELSRSGVSEFVKSVFKQLHSFATAVGWLVIVFVGIVWISNHEKSDAHEGRMSETSEKSAQVEPWHKAESKAEVARRVLARLERELSELGIAASNVVRNAKEHPLRFLSRVPEHDRTRVLVLSREDEAKIARGYVAECRAKGLFIDTPGMKERVRAIVSRLVAVVPEIGTEPEIHVLRDDSANACCLPDGTVLVNGGLLERIPDDDLLAAVLAHELGHAAARHGNEGLTRLLALAAGGVVFEEGSAGLLPMLDSGEGVSLVRTAYGIGSAVAIRLPRSRRQESEADRLGARYLARAGFDPTAMVRLFEWFEHIAPQKRDAFDRLFATHPLNADRIAHVRDVLLEPDLAVLPTRRGGFAEKAAGLTTAATNLAGRLPHLPFGNNRAENSDNRDNGTIQTTLPANQNNKR